MRRELVERPAESIARNLVVYPWSNAPAAHLSQRPYVAPHTVVDAVLELRTPAQLDVLSRAHAIALERVQAMREAALAQDEAEQGS